MKHRKAFLLQARVNGEYATAKKVGISKNTYIKLKRGFDVSPQVDWKIRKFVESGFIYPENARICTVCGIHSGVGKNGFCGQHHAERIANWRKDNKPRWNASRRRTWARSIGNDLHDGRLQKRKINHNKSKYGLYWESAYILNELVRGVNHEQEKANSKRTKGHTVGNIKSS